MKYLKIENKTTFTNFIKKTISDKIVTSYKKGLYSFVTTDPSGRNLDYYFLDDNNREIHFLHMDVLLSSVKCKIKEAELDINDAKGLQVSIITECIQKAFKNTGFNQNITFQK